MMNRDDRQLLKAQERDYKQQAKARQEELKQLNKERKQAARQRRENARKSKTQNTNPQKTKITRTLLDVFPIRDYQNNYFLTDDNQIIDIFQIRGKSYYNASDEEIEAMVETLSVFFRLYKADLKFIGMNYPTNTKNQQAFLTFKQQQPGLEKYEKIINEKLATLQYLEEKTTDREAFLMIFAKNDNHYDTLCNLINRSGLHAISIDREKKENIIFQLNNMNKQMKI